MTLNLLRIVGARPQFMQAKPLRRELEKRGHNEILLHTGQHYDDAMSRQFFVDLDLSEADINLGVGSGSHGEQTARMIQGIESHLLRHKYDAVVVDGDTNSTLSGAIAAAKLHIPVVHIEAGMRSFDKKMPEEINRIVCDHCSTLLFSPTITGLKNLQNEGFHLDSTPPYSSDNPAVFLSGDIMCDNSLFYRDKAFRLSNIIEKLKLNDKKFVLATIHRNTNTDEPDRLKEILEKLNAIATQTNYSVVFPIHPRTKKLINKFDLTALLQNIIVIEPLSFFDMIVMENTASLILTDSGGVQKEAYFYHKPCIIMRQETEWIEILQAGTGALEPQNIEEFISLVNRFINHPPNIFPEYFGNGHTAQYICEKLLLFNNLKS